MREEGRARSGRAAAIGAFPTCLVVSYDVDSALITGTVGCSKRGEGKEVRGTCHFKVLGGLTHGKGREKGGREGDCQVIQFSSSKLK